MADTSTNSWKLLYETGRQALQSRKLQEAEQSFSAALQLAEDFPAADPRLAATLNALARIYSLQRRYLAAAALLNRLLEVTERTLGPTHVQVAGVLTNLAEMYTHLGAAREELELRERVLAIRGDDATADKALLQRLRERVDELRATLEAQETPAADEEIDPLPVVRTAEYSAPIVATDDRDPAFAPTTEEHEAIASNRTPAVVAAPAPGRVEFPSPIRSLPRVERATPAMGPMLGVTGSDHGFADMGRDEYRELPSSRRFAARSSLITIAAGVVLVAGLLAARGWVAGSDDERESTGSVNLANVAAAAAPSPAAPPSAPAATEQPTVEELVAERRRETRRSLESSSESPRTEWMDRRDRRDTPVRLPSGAALERALKSVDGAVKVIDQRTRAAADSASALRLETPTFNAKLRMSETVVSRPQER
ncbi:MAG TPA: tetratricopeptide repeat protein [Gemmatimonadaceae bacterium]|jgi:tetratricopeptide (TPR) repeat protein|nr:tetratricopeptide repeat protein [Gemmatimonadaceae bacterium]